MKISLQGKMLSVFCVAVVFMFYMELVYLPHFNPLFYSGYSVLSYPLEMRNVLVGKLINVGGILLFCLSILGGRSVVYLLESLNMESDRLGCISVKGGNKENELY